VLITTNLAQEFFYGDRVVLQGSVTEAKSFEDFDYPGYLKAKNIYALSSHPKLLILKSHQLNFFKEAVLKVKAAFTKRVFFLLKEPQSSLLLGILIGAKKTLPDNIISAFNRAGLSHIIAVSGYNISVIVGSLGYLAYLIGRKKNFWLTLLFIVAFVILTGASASVIRAGLMGFLVLLSQRSGRMYHITASLVATAGIMVFLNPRILVWDAGFQLSFLATMGIVYGVPLLEKLTFWWTELKFFKTILLTTLSAIVATLPLLLFEFGQLSLIAVVANLLILPLVPPVMLVGFLSVVPFFGPGFAFLAEIVLKGIIGLVNLLTVWKYSALEFKISPLTFVILYGCVLLGYWWLKELAKKVEAKREV
jgi:competence protein ComEC